MSGLSSMYSRPRKTTLTKAVVELASKDVRAMPYYALKTIAGEFRMHIVPYSFGYLHAADTFSRI